MKKVPENKELFTQSDQERLVAEMYNQIAPVYETQYEAMAEYQVPGIIRDVYQRQGIVEGTILDIGCGTGKLKEYLGGHFQYTGIDISSVMIKEAEKRGFSVIHGDAIKALASLPDKSFDHITALSSLYFIADSPSLAEQFQRIARHSIFLTLEQFEPEVAGVMAERGIQIYNHSFEGLILSPTEVQKNVFLWKKPNTGRKIYGDIFFKKIS